MKAPLPIRLAVEDDLSESVARRVLSTRLVRYSIGPVYKRYGFGYLKHQAPAFNNAAKHCPFLLLTDLDRYPCPPSLIQEWLRRPKHPNFLFRVAVREVESWLLGDSAGLQAFLGLRSPVHLTHPELSPDPKMELLRLASNSPRRDTRDALVREDRSTGRLTQGPDYNGKLAGFVSHSWNVEVARAKCGSLRRLIVALERLETTMAG